MNIAILGWGSLIRNPGTLPIKGQWQKNGPVLWIEFSRISRKGERANCLTLVIDEDNGAEVPTQHVVSQRTDLSQAINDLSLREGCPREDIGFYETAPKEFAPKALKRHPKSCERIRVWAKDFDAVIWTALSRRFKDVLDIPFSPDAALKYVNGLPEATKKKALEYIRDAPIETMTPFRRLLLAQSSPAGERSRIPPPLEHGTA